MSDNSTAGVLECREPRRLPGRGAEPMLAVLLPCFSEATTIAGVVRAYRAALPDAAVRLSWRRACCRGNLGPTLPDLLSCPTAATTNWYLNHLLTFAGARSDRRTSEGAAILAVNAVGGAVNYGTYAALMTFTEYAARHPQLGVAAGWIAGLVFNFTGSSLLVFRPR
jgi:putative flippase GtrA